MIELLVEKGPPFLCTIVNSDTYMRGMLGTLQTLGLFTWRLSLAVCSLYFLSPHTQKQVRYFLSGLNASSSFNCFRISWRFLKHGPSVGPRSYKPVGALLLRGAEHQLLHPGSSQTVVGVLVSLMLCSELSSGIHFPLTTRSFRDVTYLAIRS